MFVPGWWAGAEASVMDTVSAGIPGWVSGLGAPGLVTLIVVLVLTDQLVVGRRLRKVERELETERKASAVKDGIIRDLTEANRTSVSLIRALKGVSEEVPP